MLLAWIYIFRLYEYKFETIIYFQCMPKLAVLRHDYYAFSLHFTNGVRQNQKTWLDKDQEEFLQALIYRLSSEIVLCTKTCPSLHRIFYYI